MSFLRSRTDVEQPALQETAIQPDARPAENAPPGLPPKAVADSYTCRLAASLRARNSMNTMHLSISGSTLARYAHLRSGHLPNEAAMKDIRAILVIMLLVAASMGTARAGTTPRTVPILVFQHSHGPGGLRGPRQPVQEPLLHLFFPRDVRGSPAQRAGRNRLGGRRDQRGLRPGNPRLGRCR